MSPSSKSHSVRGLLFATMAKGKSVLHNVLKADDTKVAITVCKKLGAAITELKPACHGFCLEIKGTGVPLITKTKSLFSGNSGITTTFALPIIGLRSNCNVPLILKCGEQMSKRPLEPIVKALNSLGMTVKPLRRNRSCPLSLGFRLQGGQTTIDGLNSQYLSSLLIALPCARDDSTILARDLHERPYVNMTLSWLKGQKINYTWHKSKNIDVFKITGSQIYKPFEKIIPGDFSSASYMIAAGALIQGQIVIEGLDMEDSQGDKKLIPLLQSMGAKIIINKQKITIYGGNPLRGKIIDCSDVPDLLPALAVVGTRATGKTVLCNIAQARIKETDRLRSMTLGLSAMGAKIEEKKDSIVIRQSKLHGNMVHGYNDHRTVMALAVAGMMADGVTKVDTAESIKKTFPAFVKMMRAIGARMR